jgi:ABC-type nitrate/sulfonate/bicarbonate transport system substrate-binding protein
MKGGRTVRLSKIVLAAALFSLVIPAQQLQKLTLTYPTRSAASWPLFIAKEGGYYQKYGLDVELKFGVHPAGIAMIVSGESAMTNYSLETAMQAGARDENLVIYGSPLNKAVFALIAQKNITRVQDLKGKRIAISQIGDAPSNYATALIGKFGLRARDIQWLPVGTDVNGRATALVSGRAEATMLTAPTYFKLEAEGYRVVANMADHDDLFASTTYLMSRRTVAANSRLPELLIKAHAEAIKRFYDDKDFAIKAYRVYDPQSEADVARFYDLHKNGNLFERIPYVLDGAIKSVIAQQSDPQLAEVMKKFDYRKTMDNSVIDRLIRERFFEQLFGASIKAEQDRKSKLAFR